MQKSSLNPASTRLQGSLLRMIGSYYLKGAALSRDNEDFLLRQVPELENILIEKKLVLLMHPILGPQSKLWPLYSPAIQNQFLSTYHLSLEQTTLQSHACTEMVQTLQRNSIPVALMRGLAIAAKCYPSIELRPSWDIDLLIRPEDLKKIDGVLVQLGYERLPSRGEINYARQSGIPCHLDLHSELWHSPLSAYDWNNLASVGLDDQTFPVLNPEDHFIEILSHSVLQHGRFHIQDALDIALFIEKHHLHWHRIGSSIKSTFLKGAVLFALSECERLFDIRFDHVRDSLEWKKSNFAAKIISRIVRPYNRSNIGHVLRPWALPGWNKKIEFIMLQMFPNASFLRERYNLKNSHEVLFWRVFRPILMVVKLIILLLKNCFGFRNPC